MKNKGVSGGLPPANFTISDVKYINLNAFLKLELDFFMMWYSGIQSCRPSLGRTGMMASASPPISVRICQCGDGVTANTDWVYMIYVKQ